MSDPSLDETGPIDFVLLEFPSTGLGNEAARAMIDLVDRGIVRVYDFVVIQKDDAGSVSTVGLTELDPAVIGDFIQFDGASSGLLADSDITQAGEAMDSGTLAVLIVFENVWAGHFGAAARRGGGQLIAFDRIPTQAIIEVLDELEAADA